jgi:hypothetical protein|tara:strand:+ start:309 stop:560 length:252 start_codon:yes stop_codon:yes gene_type:complete
MHLVADLTTGEELDLDKHGKSCNHAGYLRAISDLVDPLLRELKHLKNTYCYDNSAHASRAGKTIAYVEGKIEDKKAEIRSGIL